MSETVAEIMQDVLQNIVVQASEASVEPAEANDFIRALNRFMWRLEARQIFLGYTKVTNTGENVTVPNGALDGIVSNLSLKMFAQYVTDQLPPQTLINDAREGMKSLRSIGLNMPDMQYPQILPIGSGQDPSNISTEPFYAGVTALEANLTMSSNTTATTIATKSTAVLVAGTWTSGDKYNFTQDAAGKITYTGDDSVQVQVEAFLTAEPSSGSKVITFHLYKNGFDLAIDRSLPSTTASAGRKLRFLAQFTMSKNDYLEFYVSNDTDTTNILVSDADFRIRQWV